MGAMDLLPDTNSQLRAMLLPALFALLAVDLLLKLYRADLYVTVH
jgi:hypothetical protein